MTNQRLAVVSDIHGNLPALECVWAEIERERADLVVNLGDMRSGLSAALILCGHTHVPRAMAVSGGPLVVNPGSVGLPAYDDVHPRPHWIENGSPEARWVLLERDVHGEWHVQLCATPYDWRAAAARALDNGRGDWADALGTGFVSRTEISPD